MAQSLGIRASTLSRNARSTCPRLSAPTTVLEQRRSFSQSLAPRAKGAGMMSAQQITPKMQPEMSLRSRMRDIRPEDLPTDFGLLPGTFVRPEGDGLPPLFQEPRDRLRMEWVWLKTWFANVIGTIYYHKWNFKPGLPLELRERREIGKNLHQTMYTEFARGNERYLREKCAPGLAKNLIFRIKKRNDKEMISWNLEKYIRTPSTFFTGVRVLSDRATQIPNLADSGIRQIVLRISSQQSKQVLTKASHISMPGLTSPIRMQDCTEYMVIQKVRIKGIQKDWEIWGFTKPTTLEDLESPYFATGLTLKERVQAMQDMMSGKS